MHPLLKLIRPVNILMALASVIVGGWALREWSLSLDLLTLAFAWALLTAAANMINDAFDVEIDKINHPHRPLAKGMLKPSVVLLCAFLLIMPACYIAAVINIYLLLLVTGCLVVDYAYEKWLKKRGLAGNLMVGVLVGSGFVAGGIVTDNLPAAVLIGFLAALANTGREIVKDIEDVEGDIGRNSVVKVYGKKTAGVMAGIFFLSPVALSLMVFYPLGRGSWIYIVFILMAGSFFAASAITAVRSPKVSQRSAKIGMVAALAAFFFGGILQ